MSTQFTPGPWLMASHPSSVVGWPIVAPQAMGRSICSLNYADPKAFAGRMPGDGKFNAESKANGCLISAAPELFEALAALIEAHIERGGAFDEPCGSSEQTPEINAAVAALSKARGQS